MPETKVSSDTASIQQQLLDVLAPVEAVWPYFTKEVTTPVEEDRDGVYHSLRRSEPCHPPSRIATATLFELLNSSKMCRTCRHEALEDISRHILRRLPSWTTHAPPNSDPAEMRRLLELLLFPRGLLAKSPATPTPGGLRALDRIRELAEKQAHLSTPGLVWVLTREDLWMAPEEDAEAFDFFMSEFPRSFLWADDRLSTVLLHVKQTPPDFLYSARLGALVESTVIRSTIPPTTFEVFNTLCADARSSGRNNILHAQDAVTLWTTAVTLSALG